MCRAQTVFAYGSCLYNDSAYNIGANCPQAVLAVHGASLRASIVKNDIPALRFTINCAQPLKSIIILGSTDGANFTPLPKVLNHNLHYLSSNYVEEDIHILANTVKYYKVKVETYDNSIFYSNTATVFLNSGHLISCYPNPARDDIYFDCSDNLLQQPASLLLENSIGAVVINENYLQLEKKNIVHIMHLPNGIYHASIITPEYQQSFTINILH
jgi:hypothetical protein